MTRTCPAPGCREPVNSTRFACRVDWFRLPPALRNLIGRTYQARCDEPLDEDARNAHRAAMFRAIDWYRRNPR